jgi:membrane dipeptidase
VTKLHEEAVIIDGQGVRTSDPPGPTGGATAIVVTLAWKMRDDVQVALRAIASQLDFVDFYGDRLTLIRNADDIHRAKRTGVMGLIPNFEGMTPVGNDLSLVRIFHALGLRTMQLTYNERCLAGSGCLEPNDLGLTAFGRQLVRALERVGVLVDLTHAGRATALDALEHATRPMVFSHCNPAALFDTPQNATDEEIRACAATGGLIGITPNSRFYVDATAPRPTLDDMVTHIAYVADLVGIEHVGLAYEAPPEATASAIAARSEGDRDPRASRPHAERRVSGADSREQLPALTAALRARGFGEDDVRAVLGRNLLRVFEAAWPGRPARALTGAIDGGSMP